MVGRNKKENQYTILREKLKKFYGKFSIVSQDVKEDPGGKQEFLLTDAELEDMKGKKWGTRDSNEKGSDEKLDWKKTAESFHVAYSLVWIFQKYEIELLDHTISLLNEGAIRKSAPPPEVRQRYQQLNKKHSKNRAEILELRKIEKENKTYQETANFFHAMSLRCIMIKQDAESKLAALDAPLSEPDNDGVFLRIQDVLKALADYGPNNKEEFELLEKTMASETEAFISGCRKNILKIRCQLLYLSLHKKLFADLTSNEEMMTKIEGILESLETCGTVLTALESSLEEFITVTDIFREVSVAISPDIKIGNNDSPNLDVKYSEQVKKFSNDLQSTTYQQEEKAKVAKMEEKEMENKSDYDASEILKIIEVFEKFLSLLPCLIEIAQMNQEDDVKTADGVVELDLESDYKKNELVEPSKSKVQNPDLGPGNEESCEAFEKMWDAIELMVEYWLLEARRRNSDYEEMLEKVYHIQNSIIPQKREECERIEICENVRAHKLNVINQIEITIKDIVARLELNQNFLKLEILKMEGIFGKFESDESDDVVDSIEDKDEVLDDLWDALDTLYDKDSEQSDNVEELKSIVVFQTDSLINKFKDEILNPANHILSMKSELAEIQKSKNVENSERGDFLGRVLGYLSHKKLSTFSSSLELFKSKQVAFLELFNSKKPNSEYGQLKTVIERVIETLEPQNDSENEQSEGTDFYSRVWTLASVCKLCQKTILTQSKVMQNNKIQRLSDAQNLLNVISEKRASTKKEFGFFKNKAQRLQEESRLEWLDEKEVWLKDEIEKLEEVVAWYDEIMKDLEYDHEDEEKQQQMVPSNYDPKDMERIEKAVVELYKNFDNSEVIENLKQIIVSETDQIITDLEPFADIGIRVSNVIRRLKRDRELILSYHVRMKNDEDDSKVLKDLKKSLEKVEDAKEASEWNSDDEEDSEVMKAYMAHVYGETDVEEEEEEIDSGMVIDFVHGKGDLKNFEILNAIMSHHRALQKAKIGEKIGEFETNLQVIRHGLLQAQHFRKNLKIPMTDEDREADEKLKNQLPIYEECIKKLEAAIQMMKEVQKLGANGEYQLEMDSILQKLAKLNYDDVVAQCKLEFSRFKKKFRSVYEKIKASFNTSSTYCSNNSGLVTTIKEQYEIFGQLPEIFDDFFEMLAEKREAVLKNCNDVFEDSEVDTDLESEKLNSEVVGFTKARESQNLADSENLKIHKKAVPQNPDATDYVGYYDAGEFDEFMKRRKDQNLQTTFPVEKFLMWVGGMTALFIGMYFVFSVVLWIANFF